MVDNYNIKDSLSTLEALYDSGRILRTLSELRTAINMDSSTRIFFYVNPYTLSSGVVENYYKFENVYFVYEGNSAVFLARFLHRDRQIESLNIDDSGIVFDVLRELVNKREKIIFYGGTKMEAATAERKLLNLGFSVKCHNGYDQGSFDDVRETFTTYFLSIGSPKQEVLALKLEATSEAHNIFCCGGFIGQFGAASGTVYPSWIVKAKLRFLYRMMTDKQIFYRMIQKYPRVYLHWVLYLFWKRMAR